MRDVADGTDDVATCPVDPGNEELVAVYEPGTQCPMRERRAQLVKAFSSFDNCRSLFWVGPRHVIEEQFHEAQARALLRHAQYS